MIAVIGTHVREAEDTERQKERECRLRAVCRRRKRIEAQHRHPCDGAYPLLVLLGRCEPASEQEVAQRTCRRWRSVDDGHYGAPFARGSRFPSRLPHARLRTSLASHPTQYHASRRSARRANIAVRPVAKADRRRGTALDARAEEADVGGLQGRAPLALLGLVALLDRNRFAGDAGLDDEEFLAPEDAHVGGDHVARRELDDVTGDEIANGISMSFLSRKPEAVTLIIAFNAAAALSTRDSCTKRSETPSSLCPCRRRRRGGARTGWPGGCSAAARVFSFAR